jgi:predicted phosphoadenosine phosphosulfate sulfurtransferase
VTGTAHVHQRKTYARVPVDTDVYTLACERTAYIMDTHDRVHVMFSGGKDSTAVLNIALDVAHSDPRYARHLPLRAVFYDEEAIPQETEQYVRRVFARPDVAGEWLCLPVQHRNACSRTSPYWWPWAPEAEAKWCRPMPAEAITTLPGFPVWPPEARLTIPQSSGLLAPPPYTTAFLMGIRTQESLTRLRALTVKKTDHYISADTSPTGHGNATKAYPIYDWKTEDVWAAPKLKGWDHNAAYDVLEMAGVAFGMQRCSPAFGEEPLQKLHTFAACFPDVWARMVDRVPGVGAAARYALTELYAYRTEPTKPPGMTWPDYITHYLRQFRPTDAAHIAERLAGHIRTHYRKTTAPILYNSPHPLTGVCWRFLLMVAMRGDFKNRKQPVARLSGRPVDKLWQSYVDEATAIGTDGTAHEYAYPRPWPTDPHALVTHTVVKDTR